MFADISGFTEITEALSLHGKEGTEILSNIINEVFSPCIGFIHERGGFISNFIGDSWIAVFISIDDAVISSYQVLEEIKKQHIKTTKFGEYQISIKIGLSYGEIEWGITGNIDYNTYYFKGSAIDGASQSEKHCSRMEIIADQALMAHLDQKYEFARVCEGYHKLKAISIKNNLKVHAVNDIEGEIQRAFLPVSMADNQPLAELRDIVSIFLSFRDFDDYNALDWFCRNILNITVKWGGYFSRITFGDKGGTLLINFGIPVSYEKNMERALNCIYDMLLIFKDDIRAGVTFGRLYSGLIGSSIRSAYDVLGDSVNLSARMAMKAPWGEIWISRNIKTTADLIFNTAYIDDFQFKGKSEIISVYKLMEKQSSPARIYKNTFYGREKEAKKLKDIISCIFKGKFGGIAYVYGDAGIGKSRLIDEVIKKFDDSVHICSLQCDNLLKKAWNPFVFYLNDHFEQNTSKTKEEKESGFERIYMRLISDLSRIDDKRTDSAISELKRTKSFVKALLSLDTRGTLYEQLDPKGVYENTIYAVKEIFKSLSLIKPLIIQLEDIHWIDPDSRELINQLTRNIPDFPMILLCTSRYYDDGSKPLLDHADKTPRPEIVLESISHASAREIIRDTLENEPDHDLFAFISDRTSNNPFFIEQFCLYLKENRLLSIRNKKSYLTQKIENIPAKINQILIARIDRLSSEIRELVKIASAIGKEFNSGILLSSIKLLKNTLQNKSQSMFDMEAIQKILFSGMSYYTEIAEKENIWKKMDEIGYIFIHSLLHETAYDMQLRERLRVLHNTIAQTIEELFLSEEIPNKDFYLDLVHHFRKAEIDTKTAEYLEKAGFYLKETYKNIEAVRAFESFLDYTENKEKSLSIKLEIGTIYSLICNWDEAREIFIECADLSKEVKDNSSLARSYSQLGVISRNIGKLEDALVYLEKSKAIYQSIKNNAGLIDVYNYMGTVYYYQDEYDKALSYYNKARNMATKTGINAGIVLTSNNMGLVYYNQGRYADALECFTLARKMSEAIHDKQKIALATINIGNVYINLGNYVNALECYHKSLELLKEIGDKQGLALAKVNIGFVLEKTKSYDESLIYNQKAKEIFTEIGDQRGMVFATNNIGEIYLKKNDLRKSLEYFSISEKISQKIGNKQGVARANNSIGFIYKTEGRYIKALNCFNKALKISQDIGDSNEAGIAYNNIASIYYLQGNLSKALKFYSLCRKESEHIGSAEATATATVSMGKIFYEMENLDEALSNIDNAIKIHNENALDKACLLDCLLLKSQILYLKGSIKKAEETADEALNIANELDNPEYILKVRVKRYLLSDDTASSVLSLKELLKTNMTKELKAEIYYEIALLDKNDQSIKSALQLFEQLDESIPSYEYRKRIKKLKSLK